MRVVLLWLITVSLGITGLCAATLTAIAGYSWSSTGLVTQIMQATTLEQIQIVCQVLEAFSFPMACLGAAIYLPLADRTLRRLSSTQPAAAFAPLPVGPAIASAADRG